MSYEIRTADAPFVCRVLVFHTLTPETDVAKNLKMARYVVHEAGEFEGGVQRCRRCGALLLEIGQVEAFVGVVVRDWGFPVGRRVIVGPTCTFLVTPDRALAPDEDLCV